MLAGQRRLAEGREGVALAEHRAPRRRRHRPAREPIESTFFGSHDHDPVASWPDGPVGSLRAWDAGVTWREIETAPGQYDFGRLDAMVDHAEQHDSDVLLVLGQTPTFHAKDPAAESFYGEGASSPPDLAAWTAYVHTVAKRYAGRPVVLQVWNEANVSGFWSGTQQQMADLTKAAHDALDGITPRPTLVSPALVTRLTSQRAWIDAFYGTSVDGAPVADFVDVVSLQLYPDAKGTPETSMELLTAIRTMLTGHDVQKPIWNTEINYGLTGTEVDPAPERRAGRNVVADLPPQRGQRRSAGSTGTAGTSRASSTRCSPSPTGHPDQGRRGLRAPCTTGCSAPPSPAASRTPTDVDLHPRPPRRPADRLLERRRSPPRSPCPRAQDPREVVGHQAKPVQAGDLLHVGGLPVMVGAWMKVLVVHNRYRSDALLRREPCVDDEIDGLRRGRHRGRHVPAVERRDRPPWLRRSG